MTGLAGARHTAALTYSRPERLYYLVRGRWPQAVVDRRLAAWALDEADAAAMAGALRNELEVLRVLADEARYLVRLEAKGFLILHRELGTTRHLLGLLDEYGAAL